MKFRFCGGLDCPDWLLAEIVLLSKLSSVRVKLLAGQVVTFKLTGKIDYAKIAKLTAEASFDDSDLKAVIAAVDLIISNAAKYDVDGATLATELQQLGLPKEHSESLCRTFRDKKADLRTKFTDTTLALPRLTRADWRVDYLLASDGVGSAQAPSVQLKLQVDNDGKTETVSFDVDEQQFRNLYSELRQARDILEAAS
eukprot:TRINITY_DN5702_c0_g1_i2.p1 TRINITY_DN5702_c0_g1~~TRINITY_DN5702_c0_g1_i2.p1  ORF type:complete len:198 (+),score=44.05 TRINITY_DN5702_c0_g1_i2:174-767(+)